jgi:hypothetical protein
MTFLCFSFIKHKYMEDLPVLQCVLVTSVSIVAKLWAEQLVFNSWKDMVLLFAMRFRPFVQWVLGF